jgi:hypothetical protein
MLNERRDKLPRGWGYGGGASKFTHTKTYNFIGEPSEDSLRIKEIDGRLFPLHLSTSRQQEPKQRHGRICALVRQFRLDHIKNRGPRCMSSAGSRTRFQDIAKTLRRLLTLKRESKSQYMILTDASGGLCSLSRHLECRRMFNFRSNLHLESKQAVIPTSFQS